MATNRVMEDGRYQSWTVASKSSGDPVIYGTMTGVCLTDSDATTNKTTVDMLGMYDLSVEAIDDGGNSAVAVGDAIFYEVGGSPLLNKKSSGVLFGYAIEAITSGSTETINVLQVNTPSKPLAVQELTVSGAVTAGVNSIELNHATVAIAATIADLANHQGLLVIKDTSATGTAAHTVTATVGTFDGTNNVVTLNTLNECIAVFVDSAGNGTIFNNTGSVALS